MNANNIIILDGSDKMDFEKVTDMLSQARWSKGIKLDEVIQGAENSALVVGAFYDGVRQVGFARAISDRTRFAYIADVYVDERFRGMGIASRMINHILYHDSLKDVYEWLLKTFDAHDLYKKHDFVPLADTWKWMGIMDARPDR